MQIEELNKALATLTKKERELIEAIFYKEESLRHIVFIIIFAALFQSEKEDV